MTQQKYSDAEFKFLSAKNDADNNYKLTVKRLIDASLNTKNVNIFHHFCKIWHDSKSWNDYIQSKQSTK